MKLISIEGVVHMSFNRPFATPGEDRLPIDPVLY
jgi:hypothetical protein